MWSCSSWYINDISTYYMSSSLVSDISLYNVMHLERPKCPPAQYVSRTWMLTWSICGEIQACEQIPKSDALKLTHVACRRYSIRIILTPEAQLSAFTLLIAWRLLVNSHNIVVLFSSCDLAIWSPTFYNVQSQHCRSITMPLNMVHRLVCSRRRDEKHTCLLVLRSMENPLTIRSWEHTVWHRHTLTQTWLAGGGISVVTR